MRISNFIAYLTVVMTCEVKPGMALYSILVPEADDISGAVGLKEYVFYKTNMQSYTWLEARAVCKSIGGDMAKVDSESLQHFFNEQQRILPEFRDRDYWMGIVELTQGERVWVSDCSGLTSISNFEDMSRWSIDKLCFKSDVSRDYFGKYMDCNNALDAFLCEVQTNNTCNMENVINLGVMAASPPSEACQQSCQEDSDCLISIQVYGSCFLLGDNSTSVAGSTVSMATKNCISVAVNTSDPMLSTSAVLTMDLNCTKTPAPTTTTPVSQTTSNPSISSLMTSYTVSSSPSVHPSCNCDLSTVAMTTSSCLMTSTTTVIVPATTIVSAPSTSVISPTPMVSAPSTSSVISPTTTLAVPPSSSVIGPVVCPTPSTTAVNLTLAEVLRIRNEIIANLTIDAKSTSSYIRKMTSAHDKRQASAVIGISGLILALFPVAVILVLDCRRITTDLSSLCFDLGKE